jgi:hypothetical protein
MLMLMRQSLFADITVISKRFCANVDVQWIGIEMKSKKQRLIAARRLSRH